MTIVVTAANGRLGHQVVESLLARGVAPGDILATARTPEKIADLADRGVRTARADYDDPASLAEAFAGADRVLLVSGSEMGKRIPQHRNAVDAAKAAGVTLLAYTSIPQADINPSKLATEHRATEDYIRESGLPYSFLRNSWYFANYVPSFAGTLERGGFVGSAGEGRVSAADHRDFADATAAVLTGEGHGNSIYELGGDDSFTMADLAAELSAQSGKTVTYTDLPVAEYTKVLVGAGLPDQVADTLADADASIPAGFLEVTSGDLARLAGHPARSLKAAVAEGLA